MKNLHITPLLLLAIILLTNISCKEKVTKETDHFFTIPFAEIIKSPREVKLSEFATDVEIIQLEKNHEVLIGVIFDLKLTEGYIFINPGGNSPILQFSRDGKFIRHIGKKGRGPKEYDSVRAFSVDEKNERIYIQTNSTHKIIAYNFEGDFIKTIKYPAIERLENVWSRDSLFVSFAEPMEGDEPYIFMEHNEQGDTLQTIPNYIFWDNVDQYYNIYLFFLHNFYRFGGKLHMKGWYNDTVYFYNKNNKIVPKFSVDLGKHKLPDDLIYERKWTRPLPNGLCWVEVSETSNYIFIPYGYHFDIVNMKNSKEERGCVLYNKKTDTGIAVQEAVQWGFIDDLTGGPDFKPIFTNDTLAIMPISAFDLKQYLNSDKFEKREVKFSDEKEKLNQLKNTLNENDNHFLVLVKLKE